jgi:DNA primase
MGEWINFRAIRQSLSFEAVLRLYHVEPKIKGTQHHDFCPLPNHNGKKNSRSFSANMDKGIFQCFGCQAKGNVLDFAVLMDNGDVHDPHSVRKTALKLQNHFNLRSQGTPPPRVEKAKPEQRVKEKENKQVLVNAPLDFELKDLDAEHPYLKSRGFNAETIERFGLGFCSRGYHKGRIAIPLHNDEGKLVGYAGRIVDDTLIDEDNPKYKLPGDRERNGIIYEFRKLDVLYNSHRIEKPLDDLIIVEGFPSVWWLDQSSFLNVVAVMGSTMSEAQANLVVRLLNPRGCAWVLTDGNAAGERCAAEILSRVAPYRCCRWAKLRDEKQPTDFMANELRELFNP